MKLQQYDPKMAVEDQRAQKRSILFLERYLRAVEEYHNKNPEKARLPHRDRAYNHLYPPVWPEEKSDFVGLAPDAGAFKDHRWDQIILKRLMEGAHR